MELVKSKSMIMFIVLLIGITYIATMNTSKLDESIEEGNSSVAINL